MKMLLRISFSVLLLLLCVVSAKADPEFKLIYDRMFNEYLDNPSVQTVDGVMKILQADGSFSNIDYATKTGGPRAHLVNIFQLASAYANPDNKYYKNPAVRERYMAALKFWIKKDHRTSNWWYRSIAYPKELGRSVILMADEIKKDKALLKAVVDYLYMDFESKEIPFLYTEGANGADIIIGALGGAVIMEDAAKMMQFKDVMTHLLGFQPLKGILRDYQFAQHCGHGRQIYTLSYGREFVKSTISYIEFCNGTSYQTGNLNNLQDFFANAVQWLFHSGVYDPNASGRKISSTIRADEWVDTADRLSKINGIDRELMETIARRIAGENTLRGNRMYWRVDYMAHHGNGFMASSRMTSTRTVGNEAGNGEGEFNYYSSNGVNYIFVTGKEYDGDYFKNFNVRQFPGITAEQDTDELPVPDWGEFGSNGNGYAGGASDGTYGACGMILDRRNLTAHKSCFYFEDGFVCLGSGVSMSKGTAPVYTTVNQCNKDGEIVCSAGNKWHNIMSDERIENMKWLTHGGVAYINLAEKSAFDITLDKSVLSLNVNHGVNPDNAAYAYVVRPFAGSEKELDEYSASLSDVLSVVSDTNRAHAVYHKKANVLSVVFYEKGSIRYEDMEVETDTPCVMVWNVGKNTVTVANPYCELQNTEKITLQIRKEGKTSRILFDMPLLEDAGKGVTRKM